MSEFDHEVADGETATPRDLVERLGDVTIRPATPADVPHLPRIEDAAGRRFAEIGMPEIDEMPGRDEDSLRAAQADGLLWVADVASVGVVGFAVAETLVESLYLAELSVRPSHGRRGIGAALLQCVAEAAIERGYSQVTLSTFAQVPWNAPFYRRHGFATVETVDLPAELRAVRAKEAELGLATEQRVIMRRMLSPPTAGGSDG